MEPRINRLCGRGKNTNPQHLKQHSQTCRKGKEMAITHLIVGKKQKGPLGYQVWGSSPEVSGPGVSGPGQNLNKHATRENNLMCECNFEVSGTTLKRLSNIRRKAEAITGGQEYAEKKRASPLLINQQDAPLFLTNY